MEKDKIINKVSYEQCLFAVKKAIKAIGGVKNMKYLTGAEFHLMKSMKKEQNKKKNAS